MICPDNAFIIGKTAKEGGNMDNRIDMLLRGER